MKSKGKYLSYLMKLLRK